MTFKVILPVEATVVLALIEAATDVVVVNPPLPGLILIVPPLPNVSVCPAGGPIAIELVPALEMVALLLLPGPLSVSPLPAGLVTVMGVPDETLLAIVVPFPDRDTPAAVIVALPPLRFKVPDPAKVTL